MKNQDMVGRLTLVERSRAEAPPKAPPPADRARLEQMFVAHHAMVWRTLRRRGLDADAAADATQQTFLVGTALRVAFSVGRKTVRWQLEDDMDLRAAAGRDVLDKQAAIELCDLALSKVDADLAEIFVLFELDGLSSPEIAALLEIPLGTVASRLRRAREQFRAVVARLEIAMRREGHA